jgi:hypothetical protein
MKSHFFVIDFVAIAGTETESGLSSRLMGDPYDDTESSITSVSQIGRRRPGQRLPQLSRVQQHLRYVRNRSSSQSCWDGGAYGTVLKFFRYENQNTMHRSGKQNFSLYRTQLFIVPYSTLNCTTRTRNTLEAALGLPKIYNIHYQIVLWDNQSR